MEKVVLYTSYEEVPYHSLSNPYSHPANMATVATLLGLEVPPVRTCRVLELGSGTGPNLLPMAASLPEAEFVGIDLSPRQVAISRQGAEELGLRNVRFLEMNLLDVDAELGRYDYIIAHGMYSWLPPPVRDKLLAICRDHLVEHGLAYVSYNTYPGWHLTNVLRDLLLYRVRGLKTPEERVEAAMEALNLLVEGPTDRSDPPARLMRDYARVYGRTLGQLGPHMASSLHHDLLAETNDPVYFEQFVAHAESHHLSYVAEAPFQLTLPQEIPKQIRDRLGSFVDNNIEMEQYGDFLRMRTFRQSLLCHAGRSIDRSLDPARVRTLWARSVLKPVSSRPELNAPSVERFSGPDGKSLVTNHPVSKAALTILAEEHPRSVAFSDLLHAARQRLGQEPVQGDQDCSSPDAEELARTLLRTFSQQRQLITLRALAPKLARAAPERPVALPVARWQARRTSVVTNGYHEAASLTPLQHCTLTLLDGTRGRQELLAELSRLAEQGVLTMERGGRRVEDPVEMRPLLEQQLEEVLAGLVSLGLIMS
ncbi:MAG: class I SAM-dependent methyltransferase [Myxococcota bacterium]|nr:class I SAM-dependent methyltransferase [Myxococcota bacterium]